MRRVFRLVLTILCLFALTGVVHAENRISDAEQAITVFQDGGCETALTVNITLETAVEGLTFPLPAGAKDVTMNGTSARTTKAADGSEVVSLSHLDGLMGTQVLTFRYTLKDVLTLVEAEDEDEEDKLMVQLPMLAGFAYPVDQMTFAITMPADVANQPDFSSGYLMQSVESGMTFGVTNNVIAGNVTSQLQDHETLTMLLEVPRDMFPGKIIISREGNPETVVMVGFAIAALIVWILFLRNIPILRQRRTTPIEGITAGELGTNLSLLGADLTMMVFSWAQLGYLLIHVDRYGRVILHKRMDMGNERTGFENKCFKMLFAKGDVMDATGVQYARVWKKVSRMIPGTKELCRKGLRGRKLFRILAAGVSVSCGVCLAMNVSAILAVQILLAIVLAVLGAVNAWFIQEGAFHLYLRNRVPLIVSLVCAALWLLLGQWTGQFVIGLSAVAAQILAGFACAFGGRRTEIGRANAAQIMGLRYYLKAIPKEELERNTRLNPEFFFEMMPFALAMGVDKSFAGQFGKKKQDQCPYLVMGKVGRRGAQEWAAIMRETAERMDQRHKKMDREKWMPVTIRRR